MKRNSSPPWTLDHPRRAQGLLAALLVAWAFFMIVATALPLLAIGVQSLATGQNAAWPSFKEFLRSFGLTSTIALPISLIVCFVVGYPVWKFASARGLTRRWDAIKIGAVVGAGLYLVLTISAHIAVYVGGGRFSYWQGGVLLTKDSLPTFQGVLFDLFLTLFFAANGAAASFTAWLVGGEAKASAGARR